METSRRDFLKGGAIGAAAAGLALVTPAAPAQTQLQAEQRRRMVIRADDVGHSKVCNIGTFEAINGGMVTAVDIMLDSPGTEDALERLRAFPWLSVGWHMHMWGTPVLPAGSVPSLIEKGGTFDGRFRMDLSRAQDVDFNEAVAELRSQVNRCLKILGRVPDTGKPGGTDSPWSRAVRQIHEEFGIAYGFESKEPTGEKVMQHILAAKQRGEEWAKYYPDRPVAAQVAMDRWKHCKIMAMDGTTAFMDLLTESVSYVEKNYDPVRYYTEDQGGIAKYPLDVTIVHAWHPGYVDYYVYRLGERVNRARAQQFVVSRTQDVTAMRDPRLKKWIKEQRIELVNKRDALYGTREFQNHLRISGSELAVGG